MSQALVTVTRYPFVAAATIAVTAIGQVEADPTGPPSGLDVKVINETTDPVPVAVQGPVTVQAGQGEQLIFFRDGFTVPDGKRLLIDDVRSIGPGTAHGDGRRLDENRD